MPFTDFAHPGALQNAEILERHDFPLFELPGEYQKIHIAEQGITVECIIAPSRGHDKTTQDLLDMAIASGYIRDDSDITFHVSESRGYFCAYFHLHMENAASDDGNAEI